MKTQDLKLRITSEKVEKYTDNQKKLLQSINDSNGILKISTWLSENSVSNEFSIACRNLGYITVYSGESRKGLYYKSNLLVNEIEPRHGRLVYEEVSRIRKEYPSSKRKQLSKEPENKNKNIKLIEFTDMDLFDEIKNRGYVGELTKTVKQIIKL